MLMKGILCDDFLQDLFAVRLGNDHATRARHLPARHQEHIRLVVLLQIHHMRLHVLIQLIQRYNVVEVDDEHAW